MLANHWIHDGGDAEGPARLLSQLGGHFDLVLQSCREGRRVPEASMFSSALQQLGVTSQQVPPRRQTPLRVQTWVRFNVCVFFRPCGWTPTRVA